VVAWCEVMIRAQSDRGRDGTDFYIIVSSSPSRLKDRIRVLIPIITYCAKDRPN
jgi:hypothetical protein